MANYVLIGINILIFVLSYHPHSEIVQVPHPRFRGIVINQQITEPLRPWAQNLRYDPSHFKVLNLITYQFLHANFMHIFGNMYFLYFFGNAVNSRLGNKKYVIFYLLGGMAAGLGHSIFSNSPVLGASGSIAAVTGAFLALYPKAIVHIVYWFFFIGTFELPALWFIGLKLIFLDNILAQQYSSARIAYFAHLSGYASGIIGALIMLKFKLAPRSHFDLLSLIERWHKRRTYRDEIHRNDSAPDHTAGGIFKTPGTVRDAKFEDAATVTELSEIEKLRLDINTAAAAGRLSDAANDYIRLVKLDSTQVMPHRHQLDIANQLMSDGQWQAAADAYIKLILHYPNCEHIEQIHLMLGVLYSRYLNKPQQARDYLEKALSKLRDEKQIQMCRDMLDNLN